MNNKDDAIEEDEAMGVGESSGEVAAAKSGPQRANKNDKLSNVNSILIYEKSAKRMSFKLQSQTHNVW